jgi:hypothetical protein
MPKHLKQLYQSKYMNIHIIVVSISYLFLSFHFLFRILDWLTEPLNPLEQVTPNDLGYLYNLGPNTFFQLMGHQFFLSIKHKEYQANNDNKNC